MQKCLNDNVASNNYRKPHSTAQICNTYIGPPKLSNLHNLHYLILFKADAISDKE